MLVIVFDFKTRNQRHRQHRNPFWEWIAEYLLIKRAPPLSCRLVSMGKQVIDVLLSVFYANDFWISGRGSRGSLFTSERRVDWWRRRLTRLELPRMSFVAQFNLSRWSWPSQARTCSDGLDHLRPTSREFMTPGLAKYFHKSFASKKSKINPRDSYKCSQVAKKISSAAN